MIIKLAWRNLWRNRRRTFITTTSVAFAVLLSIMMQSLQKGIFDNLIKEVVGLYYGYVQVHSNGYWDEPLLDNSFALNDSMVDAINQNQHVKLTVPRIEGFSLASVGNITKGCMVIGTDPELENDMTKLREKISTGTYFNANEKVALVAEGLAERLNLKLNDTIILLGQGYQGMMAADKFAVKGLLHFATPDLNDGLVYLPLVTAQEFFSMGNRATSLALSIDEPELLFLIQSDVKKITGNDYEVMTWEEMMPDVSGHIKAEKVDFYVFNGVLYIIIAFGIFGTILMMTIERRYEFGMLLAIGMQRARMATMLLIETFFISFLGVLTGTLLSLPFVIYFKFRPIVLKGEFGNAYKEFGFQPIMPTAIDGEIFITQAVIVLILVFIICLYPIFHVRKIEPVTSMKK